MGIAFCAQESQGQEREELTQRRYHGGSRQTGLAHDLREREWVQEGSEEKHSCSGGFPMAIIEFSWSERFGTLGKFGSAASGCAEAV
jgi:hypothetical protein